MPIAHEIRTNIGWRKMKNVDKKEINCRGEYCLRGGEIYYTLNFDEALQIILDTLDECLGLNIAAVHLLDAAGRDMMLMEARNLSEAYKNMIPTRISESPIYQEIMKGKIITIVNARKNPLYHKLAECERIRSILCAPLKSKNHVIGALWVFTLEGRQFTQSEINYVTTFSNQWGVILGNAKQHQRLHALSEIGKAVTSQLDLQKVLKIIVEKAALLFGAKGASLLLLRRGQGALEVAASYGLSEEFLTKGPVLAEESIKNCLEHSVIIPDISQSSAVKYPDSLQKEGIQAIICAPLMAKGKCIGNLRVYMDHPGKFTPEDRELLQLLSDFGGISIENARLFNHIKREYEDLEQDVWQWYDWGKRSPKL